MTRNNIGWNFQNSYLKLADIMVSKLPPVPVKNPKIVLYNAQLELDQPLPGRDPSHLTLVVALETLLSY